MAKNSKNVLALGVGLNLDPLNQDIANAAKTAKEGMSVVAQSVVDGGAKASGATEKFSDKVVSMRAQLRQATQDAQQMAEKYGIMSTQAIASASKAGELKDKIGDINTVITAFSADSKFTVVAGALQSAAGAASIVTGSMALLGVESKETQAMLLKVQGALALTQGLATIKEMGASFTALRAVIVGQVIPSLTAMGTAMNVALGIAGIALAAVITAVVMYNNSLDDEANALKAATEAQAANNKAVADSQKIIIDTQNLRTRAMKDGLEKELRINKDKIAIEQYQNELAYSQGEISAATFENRKIYIKQNGANEEAKIRKAAHDKELSDVKKHHVELAVIYAQPIEIKSQFVGGGQSNLPSLTAPQAPTMPVLSNQNSLANQIRKQTEDARQAMLEGIVKMQEAGQRLNEGVTAAMQNGLANSLSGLGKIIGDSINGNITDPFAALGDMLLQSIGGVMTQLGAQMIALGVGMLALDLGIKTLNPFVAIAGGIALVAAGSAISGIASKGTKGGLQAPSSSGGNQSSYSGNNSNYIGGQNSGTLVISGYVKGNDINFVNGKSGAKNNRNLRFG